MANVEVHPGPEDSASRTPDDASGDGPAHATTGDRVLLAAFWLWAALLLLATLAHLFGWNGVLDVLDVKHWFSK